MIAYRVRFEYGQATITEFSYEGTTPAFYTGCKLVREVRGFGYVPRSGKIPKLDTCPTLQDAVISMSGAARKAMEQKQREVNRINSEIGQLESLLRKSA
jgi:hypothetical protein